MDIDEPRAIIRDACRGLSRAELIEVVDCLEADCRFVSHISLRQVVHKVRRNTLVRRYQIALNDYDLLDFRFPEDPVEPAAVLAYLESVRAKDAKWKHVERLRDKIMATFKT
ncbi:hypothetical protein [Thiocystis violascens]|uniref:Uncharacterized protein n=1 Tax=Thiocystis violascens (strain ATCC 17096 / DSM 198 / 6111) TaxID=765911 RepID=I3YGU0_THIV6|nr:hypothetical protein [Thiocystis violascens]AFL76208.1 hypothetical protein Thivi_4405 [Thiocystis violascens DSM 198]